jgi:hypothetical protein
VVAQLVEKMIKQLQAAIGVLHGARIKEKKRCCCGRFNTNVKPYLYYTNGYVIRAPWCNASLRCSPLTSEERASIDMRAYHTRLTAEMVERLDAGVREAVIRCRTQGWPTLFSCDGHGKKHGYITFWEREHRDEALAFLGAVEAEDRPNRFFGMFYNLRLPKMEAP